MLEEKEGVMRNAMTTRAPCGANNGAREEDQPMFRAGTFDDTLMTNMMTSWKEQLWWIRRM